MFYSVLAIALGSILGGLSRWYLSLRFNSLSMIPYGTLLANLIAGYLIGLVIAFLASSPQLSVNWRSFLITGFCGGLSTFSTFSAEVISLFQRGHLYWGIAEISIHVAGSLFMTAAGIASFHFLKRLCS